MIYNAHGSTLQNSNITNEKVKSEYRLKLERIKEKINLSEIFSNSKSISKQGNHRYIIPYYINL